MTTIRALIATTVKKKWQVLQLDVNNAFLHGDLHEEVYMEIPPGLVVDSPGLVQVEQVPSEGSVVFVAIYVDDVLVTGTHLQEIESLKTFLHSTFKIKDLGRLHYFLGLEIQYTEKGILMSQRKFTIDLLRVFGCIDCPSMTSPMDPSVKLKANKGAPLPDPSYYRKLIGKLNFLTNTRLDIAYSVQHLSQFMKSLREPHLKAAYHVLRYLKGDPSLGIFINNNADYGVNAFCDSDWATCSKSRKSVSGYIVLLGTSPISWKSKKQSTISLSSTEAEYRSARMVVGELVWLARLLNELTVPLALPIPIFCDSQATLHIARNLCSMNERNISKWIVIL
ncbi:uncharacterized mitochondrial protein AtMg00810-like [Nicotiana sylvestris]|uniref:Uncharacterized mitochondrial protein AtMg00810-like n=1 Tax=Nicotiana tabacum TaxID=4097 RepID=A0A1S4D3Q6_TOBAC|nr:PREDICTED: uncharacterized mitochondrial protein AtMg00810-like [Nicotiana tabacum]